MGFDDSKVVARNYNADFFTVDSAHRKIQENLRSFLLSRIQLQMKQGLSEFVVATLGSLASDPRDKLYGLLSLVSPPARDCSA